jgi:hypothetical protein
MKYIELNFLMHSSVFSWEAVAGLHLSPPREAGPLTHNIMFYNNLFSLKGSKIIRLHL